MSPPPNNEATIIEPPSTSAEWPLRRLSGHEHIVLTDERRGWVIRKGYLSVYLVRLSNGEPIGQRRYLLSTHEGTLLAGAPARCNDSDFALIAVALDECECQEVDLAEWGRDENQLAALNLWVDRLCRLVEDQVGTVYAERADPSGPFSVGESLNIRPAAAGLHALQVESGSLALYGRTVLPVTPDSGRVLVLGDTWFSATEAATGRFESIRPGCDAEALRAGLCQLVRLFVSITRDQQQREEETERDRLNRLATLQETQEAEAVRHLSFVDAEQTPLPKRETPLLTCLDAIAADMGIILATDPAPRSTLPVHEQINAIARSSGTRARRVRLLGDWWEDDSSAILAFKQENGSPVALLSVAERLGLSRHYEMLDPVAGTRTRVGPEMRGVLSENAYVFLRPLPSEKEGISFVSLTKFTFSPFLKDLRLVFLLSVIGSLIGIFMPFANRMMIDEVIPDANRRLMFDLAIGLSAMSLALFFFTMSQSLVSLRVKTGLGAHLQSAIIDRLLRLPPRFFRKFSSGDLLMRAMMITTISAGMSMTIISALFGLLSTLVMLGLCFYYSRPLAWLALIAAAVTSIITVSFSYLIRKRALELEVRRGKLFGLIVQMIHGVSKLQVAGGEIRAFNQWAKDYGGQLRMQDRMAYLQHWSGLINTGIQTSSTIALYYLAGTMVQKSEQLQAVSPLVPPLLTIGMFFAVQMAFSAVVGGIVSFCSTFITVHQQMEKRKLVRPILEEPIEDGGGRIDPGRLDGHILVRQVSFRYGGAGAPLVLKSVDLQAYPGEFIALVGPSGGGKTTLLKLLLGFEAPESGQILFDKKDVKDLDMTAVRRQTGVVLQDGKISGGTIFHNIAGATQISLEDAWEAAEDAGFAEDVRGMPMGMHTLLPEGGTTLSGGQRQRLLIARALAVKPRLIFFDEATSALDNRTQEIVTESLKRRQITRIVVAHRLTTIMDADRIYVLEAGAVAQKGTYAELMAQEGLFKTMASRQLT